MVKGLLGIKIIETDLGRVCRKSTYPGASMLTLAHAFVGLGSHQSIASPFFARDETTS